MELLHKIPKLRWLPVRHWYDLRNAMRLSARVRDPVDGLVYRSECDSFESYQRARTFLGKEPETIAWLRKSLRPSDVFLDIGANIGIFSIFAGKHRGPEATSMPASPTCRPPRNCCKTSAPTVFRTAHPFCPSPLRGMTGLRLSATNAGARARLAVNCRSRAARDWSIPSGPNSRRP